MIRLHDQPGMLMGNPKHSTWSNSSIDSDSPTAGRLNILRQGFRVRG